MKKFTYYATKMNGQKIELHSILENNDNKINDIIKADKEFCKEFPGVNMVKAAWIQCKIENV